MLAHFEKLTAERQDASFLCRRFDSPSFTTPWHFHPELELTLIVQSEGQRFVGDSIEPFQAGDLVLLGPNLPHCWLNTQPRQKARQQRSRSIVVQFAPEALLPPGGRAWPELRGIRSLLENRSPRGVHFTGAIAARVGTRLRRLPDADGLPRLLGLLSLLDTLAQVPARHAKPLASEGFVPSLNRGQADRLERVCRFVQRDFREAVMQVDAAALAHLTPEAFSRFFRQKTGKTFIDYLNDVRVGEACRLLIEKETVDVTEICYACGFRNVSNFNRHFRMRHGISPREYRRRTIAAIVDPVPRRLSRSSTKL